MLQKSRKKNKNSFGKILDIVIKLCYYIIRKEVDGMRPNKKKIKSLTITLNFFIFEIKVTVEWA